MNNYFLPISVLPTFQTFCPGPVGVHFALMAVQFAHFQVQARKGVFLGGVGGVLSTYISPKGFVTVD